MPKRKRVVHERTEDWTELQRRLKWPEQVIYELIRPVVVFGKLASERAHATGAHERTIDRKADAFDHAGMRSLMPAVRPVSDEFRTLSPPLRQLIVNLHAEAPHMSLREIALVCEVQFGRRPSHHSVQRVLATGPTPSVTRRRFPAFAQIHEPVRRRLAIVQLHAEGWRVQTIARYLDTTKRTVYRTLQRWVAEQFAGLEDKSHAPNRPATKATLPLSNQVRKLQQNPELGAWPSTPHCCNSASPSARGPAAASWRATARSMVLTSRSVRLDPSRRCPTRQLNGTSFGRSTSDILRSTN